MWCDGIAPNAIKLAGALAVVDALRRLTPALLRSPTLSIASDKEGKARNFS